MSLIQTFFRRETQPPAGVGVNKKWIDRGLVALFDCRQARELISGDFATNRTSLIAPSTRGIAADFSGSANQQYAHRPDYVITGPITIAPLCDIAALTNYSAIISKMGTTTTNVPYELRVGAAATDAFINFARANTAARDRRGASNRLTVPFSGLIAVTAPSGLIESVATLYVNNVPTVLSSNASGTGLGTDNGSAVWIGRRYDGATQLAGRIYYVPLFNAELSAAYLKELYENPWDVYEEEEELIFSGSTGGVSVSPGAGAITITGYAPAIQQPITVSPSAGAIAITGYAPSITQSASISPGAGAITITGYAPAIQQPITVSPSAGAIAITGYTPSITQTATISPGAGAITITGYAPTIQQPITVSPGAGAIAITGYTPSITQTATISPGAGAITITGYAPTIQQPITVSPGAGAITVEGFTPGIIQTGSGITISPITGAITITGFSPSISQPGTPAQQQILNRLKALLLAGSTAAGSRVFLHRTDPLQPEELPAIVIDEDGPERAETVMMDGGERREIDAIVYCTLASSTTAPADAMSFGLAAEKLIAADPTLKSLCQFGVNILERSTILNGDGDRALAASQQKWRFAYWVHPDRPDIINPT